MKITLSVDGGAPQTFDYATGAASRPDAPTGSLDGGPMLRNGQPNFTPNMAAGAVYTFSLEVSPDDVGSAGIDVGQGSALGGSRKTVTLEKDGVVISIGPPEQNTLVGSVTFGNPTGINYLTPGTWVVKVLFSDPGAAVVTISA